MKTLCFVVLELFLFNSIASPSPPSGTREIKRVLILYSEDRDHPGCFFRFALRKRIDRAGDPLGLRIQSTL